jgi:hypothetical protein
MSRNPQRQRNVCFQPSPEEFPADLPSFAVFRRLRNGRRAYPSVRRWVGYRRGQIEEPTYLD